MVHGTREDAVHARQEEHTTRMADLVALPPPMAAAMPWHFKWRATTVEGHFFTDRQRVHGAICRSALLVFFFRVLGCSSDLAGSLVMGDEMWNRSWQPSMAVQLAS